MRLGPLRHRVAFEARSATRDEFGQQVEGWAQVAQVWASIEPLSGRELLAAQQVQGEVTHRIRCRYVPGLETAHRAVFNGRAFEVRSIINTRELNAALEILAAEGLTDGR